MTTNPEPSLVEQVGRTMARAYWIKFRSGSELERMIDLHWREYAGGDTLDTIRAVLDAIAEPSEAIVCAGDEAIVQILNVSPLEMIRQISNDTPASLSWRAMIAALRKEIE